MPLAKGQNSLELDSLKAIEPVAHILVATTPLLEYANTYNEFLIFRPPSDFSFNAEESEEDRIMDDVTDDDDDTGIDDEIPDEMNSGNGTDCMEIYYGDDKLDPVEDSESEPEKDDPKDPNFEPEESDEESDYESGNDSDADTNSDAGEELLAEEFYDVRTGEKLPHMKAKYTAPVERSYAKVNTLYYFY
jgi:hypothetical protein